MIIHLNGWPGVGKLTIARHVAERLDGRLLDNHAIYNPAFSLADFRSPEFYALVRAVRDAAFQRVAEISPAVPRNHDQRLWALRVGTGKLAHHS